MLSISISIDARESANGLEDRVYEIEDRLKEIERSIDRISCHNERNEACISNILNNSLLVKKEVINLKKRVRI